LALGGLRQDGGVVDHAGISTLRFDDSFELFGRASGGKRFLELAACPSRVANESGEQEHLSAQGIAQLQQVGRAFAVEREDSLLDFERITAGATERTVHCRD